MTLPKKKVERKAEEKDGTMLVGVLAVCERLKCSQRTASRYKVEYKDFPVTTEPKTGIWKATAADIDGWREKHIDLFVSRKERLDRQERLFGGFPRRW